MPAEPEPLKKRLLVVCPPGGGRTQGVDATMARLNRQCVWAGMAGDVRNMTLLCRHCADTNAGALVPRVVDETPHGREPNAVVHFDFSTWRRARWMSVLTLRIDFNTCQRGAGWEDREAAREWHGRERFGGEGCRDGGGRGADRDTGPSS